MKKEEEVNLAWSIWNLVNDLCGQLWERYEGEFLDRYMEACDNERGDAVQGEAAASVSWRDGSRSSQGAGRRTRE